MFSPLDRSPRIGIEHSTCRRHPVSPTTCFAGPRTPPVHFWCLLSKVHSFILVGIEAQLCEVEVDVSHRGLEKTAIVGLAQAAVKESIERVNRAIVNSGYAFPGRHLLVNL